MPTTQARPNVSLKISIFLGSDLKASGKPEHSLGCTALFTERQAALEGQPGRHQPGLVLLLAELPCRLIGQRPLYFGFL